MPTAEILDKMQDGVLVNSLRQAYSNYLPTAEILDRM